MTPAEACGVLAASVAHSIRAHVRSMPEYASYVDHDVALAKGRYLTDATSTLVITETKDVAPTDTRCVIRDMVRLKLGNLNVGTVLFRYDVNVVYDEGDEDGSGFYDMTLAVSSTPLLAEAVYQYAWMNTTEDLASETLQLLSTVRDQLRSAVAEELTM